MKAALKEPEVLISEVGPRDGLQSVLPKGWVQGVIAA